MSAVLKKPEKFQGSPIFADDRGVNPLTDSVCQIRPTNEDKETYRLLITDLDECGILVKNVSVFFEKSFSSKVTTLYKVLLTAGASSPPRQPRQQLPWLIFGTIIN